MISQKLQELSEQGLDSKDFVEQALNYLETGFREISLTALGDWHATGLSSLSLFNAVAALNHPAWGSWNGLLNDLKNARRKTLRDGSAADRQMLGEARSLEAILELREKRVPEEILSKLQDCRDHIRYEFSSSARLKQLMELPIAIRNIMVHQMPEETVWWDWAQKTLEALIQYFQEVGCLEPENGSYPSPWFIEKDGETYSYNGLSNNDEAVYITASRHRVYDSDRGREVVEIFKAILGHSDLQTEQFRKLISKAAPESSRGILLDDFLLQKPTGEGGFATVYLATQLSTSRKVAVKILKDGMDEDVKERFRNEARHLAGFYDNENIVDVINYGETSWRRPPEINKEDIDWYENFAKGAPIKDYIAMEWVEGRTLNELYHDQKSSGKLYIHRLTRYFLQAARAVAAIHASGLIHRDIKPDNMMLDINGKIKLMDFGIARSDDENRKLITLTGAQLGTPAYMSPEQIRAKDAEAEVGKATDIYSLGVTFYELFTSSRLYDHDSDSAVNVNNKKLNNIEPKPPKDLNSRIPGEVAALLEGCLRGEIEDRISSSRDLVRDLERYLSHLPIAYRKPSFPRRIQLNYRRNKQAFILSMSFAIIIAGATLFYIQDIKQKEKKATDANRALSGAIGQLGYHVNFQSGDLELKGLFGELILDSKDHLQASFYPDSFTDSLASVLLCQNIANQLISKNALALLDNSYEADQQDLSDAQMQIDKMEEILKGMGEMKLTQEVRKGLEGASMNPLNFVEGLKNEVLLARGYAYLLQENYSEAEIFLNDFIKTTQAQLLEKSIPVEVAYLNLSAAHIKLGHAYRKIGKLKQAGIHWDEGLAYQEKHLQLVPNDNDLFQLYLLRRVGVSWGIISLLKHQGRIADLRDQLVSGRLLSAEMDDAITEFGAAEQKAEK